MSVAAVFISAAVDYVQFGALKLLLHHKCSGALSLSGPPAFPSLVTYLWEHSIPLFCHCSRTHTLTFGLTIRAHLGSFILLGVLLELVLHSYRSKTPFPPLSYCPQHLYPPSEHHILAPVPLKALSALIGRFSQAWASTAPPHHNNRSSFEGTVCE